MPRHTSSILSVVRSVRGKNRAAPSATGRSDADALRSGSPCPTRSSRAARVLRRRSHAACRGFCHRTVRPCKLASDIDDVVFQLGRIRQPPSQIYICSVKVAVVSFLHFDATRIGCVVGAALSCFVDRAARCSRRRLSPYFRPRLQHSP